MLLALLLGALLLVCVLLPVGTREARAQTSAEPLERVLVFSKTAGFRHSSIPTGIAAIQKLGTDNGFAVDATEDAAQFNDANLSRYDAVVFLSTTGDVLNNEQQAAFERYIGDGGGYVGIHAAADTEYGWGWYGQLVGAYFKSHPQNQNATVKVEDGAHPSTSHLPANWQRFDEWYNYQKPTDPAVNGGGDDYSPRQTGVHVLAELDENTYDEADGSAAADDHPIAWCSTFTGGGRSFYTGGGHTEASFTEQNFTRHLLGGIRYAGGAADGDCGTTRENPATQYPPGDDDFQQVTLAKGGDVLGEPVGMTVLPDRRVLTTARDGSVYLVTPDARVSLAAKVPVYTHDEDGLQGVAVDPNFEQNRWVYLFYSPPLATPGGDAPTDGTAADFAPYEGHNQVSRFKMTDNGTIDLQSEQKLLQIETDRGQCCHGGGEMDFDADGNLYISTGDDTNPFQSEGYTPIDERSSRNPVFDAQRSSANTNVLSGKLLRIKPDPTDASYTVPEGNLFPEAGDTQNKTRPEIYAMGFRNPYRFDVDPETGDVLLGDYGPDAGGASATRGPGGQVEFNLIKEAGNYGWPYCTGRNTAAETYNDYNFATGQSGAKFDCAAPVNQSPNNTGLTNLPPAKAAWIPYDNCSVPEFGCGSESPMGGPTYRYDENLQSETKFPAYYDGKMFLYEWGRRWIKTVTENPDGSRGEIEPFFDSMTRTQVMNLEFGPEGSLYVLDYGTGFFTGDANSALYRIDYVQGSRAPTAEITATPDSGPSPLDVQFSSEGSNDPDEGDSIAKYEWDFDNDGTVDSTAANPTHTYAQNGTYTARLTVTDTTGKTGTATENIIVGNTRPTIEIETPVDGGFYSYRSTIDIRVKVTDPEDGEQVDCSKVRVDTALGHNEHTHGDQNFTGCSGSVTIPAPWEDQTQKIFYLVNATYTDGGGPNGGAPLTATTQHVLQPKTVQAEHYTSAKDVAVYDKNTAQGGKGVGSIEDGDYISYGPMNLTNIQSVSYRATSNGQGGIIEMRAGSPTGPLVATTQVNNNGNWDNFTATQPTAVDDPGGTHEMFFVFKKPAGSTRTDALYDLDSIGFAGRGVDANGAPQIDSAAATPQRGEAPLDVNFTSSATEPEGEALSYKWDFGVPSTEEDTATTKDASYTYTEPGTYTATLTASDPGGRNDTRTFKIDVEAPSAPCATPGSDEFDGTSLDRSLWSTIVREDASRYSVGDGALTVRTTGGDMYGGTTNANNLILQPTPDGAWVARTKVTADLATEYQQAGMMVYGSDSEFVKLSFLAIPDGQRKFEFIRQSGGQPRNDAADSTANLPADFPDTVYLEIRSDGTNLTAAYSTDGVNWTSVGRSTTFEGMGADPKVGLLATNPGTAQSFDGVFERFSLVQPSDEFDGSALEECRWTEVVRENPEGYRVAAGALKIDTGDGKDMYGGNTNAENIVTQKAPTGSWQATTKVDLPFTGKDYEQAGMMVYGEDQNFVKLSFIKVPGGRNIEFIQQQGGQPVDGGGQDRTPILGNDVPNSVYLRITSDGTNLRAAWSKDGQSWTDFGRPRPLSAVPNPHIGLAAFNGNGSGNEASFDFFRMQSEIPLTATATADKTSGRAPLAVNFTGSSAGGENTTYAWDFGVPGTDADRATTKDASYTYTEAGTYTATLTATDASGTTATDTVEIAVGQPVQPCDTPYEPEPGYRMLFDGTDRSLEGWTQSGGGGFERDGCAIESYGPFGLFWYEAESFEAPYSLKLEWMKPGDDNSGVFVGFEADGANTVNSSITRGEEIQIDSTDDPDSTTGAIYNEQAADTAARDAALRPDGQWNEYEIRVEADRIIVFLNGTKINEWVDDDPNVDLSQGHIGVQNHGTSGPNNPDEVFFRNIRVNDGSTPTNNPPVADDESATTSAGEPVDIDVLGGDTDPDGDTLSVESVTDPDNGTAVKNDAGTVKYTPDTGFTGTDTFDYTVSDGKGGTDTGTVTVTVEEAASNAEPRISKVSPRDGVRTRDRTPTIGATVTDGDGPLSSSDIQLTLDGREVTEFSYNAETGKVRYVPERRLGYGNHKVKLVAEDGDGGGDTEKWDFRVEKRRR